MPPPPPPAAATSLGDPPSPGGFLAAGRRAGRVRGGVGDASAAALAFCDSLIAHCAVARETRSSTCFRSRKNSSSSVIASSPSTPSSTTPPPPASASRAGGGAPSVPSGKKKSRMDSAIASGGGRPPRARARRSVGAKHANRTSVGFDGRLILSVLPVFSTTNDLGTLRATPPRAQIVHVHACTFTHARLVPRHRRRPYADPQAPRRRRARDFRARAHGHRPARARVDVHGV